MKVIHKSLRKNFAF